MGAVYTKPNTNGFSIIVGGRKLIKKSAPINPQLSENKPGRKKNTMLGRNPQRINVFMFFFIFLIIH
jgi:hypothetical protein